MEKGMAYLENFFVIFYLKYLKILKGYLKKIVKDEHISEELAHDAFIKFFEKVNYFDPQSSKSKNFLFTIARNFAFDYLKRKNMEVKKYSEIHFEEVTIDRMFYKDIEDAYIEGEIISTIHDTISEFPAKKRDVYIDRVINGVNYKNVVKNSKMSKFKINKIEKEINRKIKKRLIYKY